MADHTHAGTQFPYAVHFPPDINRRFFGALQVYPQGRVYEGLEPDEQVVLLLRQHWIVLLKPLLIGLGLALTPAIVLAVSLLLPLGEVMPRYGVVLAWFLLTFTAYYFISLFVRYVSDAWVITTERIIDLDANLIAYKNATEVDLSAVAGASQVRGGGIIFGGIDRGTVLIRIIGEEDSYIPDVPMSGSVAQVIGELAESVQRERSVTAGAMLDPKLSAI